MKFAVGKPKMHEIKKKISQTNENIKKEGEKKRNKQPKKNKQSIGFGFINMMPWFWWFWW